MKHDQASHVLNLVGHRRAWDLMERWVASETLPPALLLTGPTAIGKRRFALRLAARLLCCATGQRPCGTCRDCTLVVKGQHELLVTVGGGDEPGLTIDDLRSLQQVSSLKVVGSAPRVALLLNLDEASEQAANSLLKFLEEPPPHTVTIATASDAERLPATLRSRLALVRLGLVSGGEIREFLDRSGYDQSVAQSLTTFAAGRPERILPHLADHAWLREEQARSDRLTAILQAAARSTSAFQLDIEAYVGAARDSEELAHHLEHLAVETHEHLKTSLGDADARSATRRLQQLGDRLLTAVRDTTRNVGGRGVALTLSQPLA